MENPEKNQNFDTSKSNFFTGAQPIPLTQSPSQNPNQIQQSNQNEAFPPNNPQISNIPLYNPNQNQQINLNMNQQPVFPFVNPIQPQNKSSQSFIEKVNSTASGVFDFLKSKAPPIPTNIITKKLLDNVDPLTIITEIKEENFKKILEKSIKEIDCLKLEKTKLNDLTIEVVVSNPKQITNNSFFSKNYVLYDISTPKLNWVVNRRYSDFIWLRDCLKYLFPGDILPILPKKKIGKRFYK